MLKPATDRLPVHVSYLEAYNEIRNITGVGSNKGPFIAIHDGQSFRSESRDRAIVKLDLFR